MRAVSSSSGRLGPANSPRPKRMTYLIHRGDDVLIWIEWRAGRCTRPLHSCIDGIQHYVPLHEGFSWLICLLVSSSNGRFEEVYCRRMHPSLLWSSKPYSDAHRGMTHERSPTPRGSCGGCAEITYNQLFRRKGSLCYMAAFVMSKTDNIYMKNHRKYLVL